MSRSPSASARAWRAALATLALSTAGTALLAGQASADDSVDPTADVVVDPAADVTVSDPAAAEPITIDVVVDESAPVETVVVEPVVTSPLRSIRFGGFSLRGIRW